MMANESTNLMSTTNLKAISGFVVQRIANAAYMHMFVSLSGGHGSLITLD